MSLFERAGEAAAEKGPSDVVRRADDQAQLMPDVLPGTTEARPTGTMVSFHRAVLLDAQRSIGNRAVSATVARSRVPERDEVISGAAHQSFSLRVAIPWGRDSTPPVAPAPSWSKSLISPDSVEAGGPEVTVEEPEPGTVNLSVTDALSSALTFNSAVTVGNPGLGPSEFGLTTISPTVKNPVAKGDGAKKVFNVTADVEVPIRWEVHSLGRTNIASSASPALKKGNWAAAVTDLTPDTSSDGGRPPRTNFWAQDLTERHELFHAGEMGTFGKAAFDLAAKWLDTQTASDEAGAIAVTNQVPNQMTATIRATFVPKSEFRAYSDGAPSYQSRVNDIKKTGDAGSYPA